MTRNSQPAREPERRALPGTEGLARQQAGHRSALHPSGLGGQSAQRLDWALEACRRLRLRLTPTRRAILGCLAERRTLVTLETIAAADGVRGACDATTVYRTLTLFKEAELVRLVSSPRKQSCFLLNVPDEGGNLLVCRHCGETLERPLPPALASDLSRLVAQQGFAPGQWDCVVHGLCQRCERELKNKVIPTKLSH